MSVVLLVSATVEGVVLEVTGVAAKASVSDMFAKQDVGRTSTRGRSTRSASSSSWRRYIGAPSHIVARCPARQRDLLPVHMDRSTSLVVLIMAHDCLF